MAKRSGRVGQWVLPVGAAFITVTLLWALTRLVSLFLATAAPGAAAIFGLIAAALAVLAIVFAAATLAGAAFLLLATLQQLQQSSQSADVQQAMRRLANLLEQVSNTSSLSDRAKAVAFREKERDALRHAIQEDLAKQDWEAAYHLIDEMQRAFGYQTEAERLRAEVDQRRSETIMANLAAEMGLFRELLNNRDWSGARAEAENLAARYPDHPRVGNLLAEVDEAREAYKRRLLNEFKQAIDRSEIDRGVSVLKELDTYLTPGEAAGLQEAARGVFRAKLHNLGVQFSMAISEKNWQEAIAIGDEIVNEFPNSRMAEEVRQTRDALQQRASGEKQTA